MIHLLWQQIRHQNRMFWRNPVAAFFTLVLPLVFLLLVNVLFGGAEVRGVPFAQFFTPAIGVFAAVSATFTNLAIGTAIARDQGVLKRIRGTPLRPWLYIAGRISSAIWIAFLSVTLMFGVGWLVYDVEVLWGRLPQAVLVFVIGVAAFSAMGLAVASLVRKGDAVPAAANAVILPMAFVSDIFLVPDDPPKWLELAGDVLPLKHFARLFGDAFNPLLTEPAISWDRLAVIGAWGLAAGLLAVRYFRWSAD